MITLLLLLGLIAQQAISVKVFNFKSISNSPQTSYVTLKNFPASDLPKKFTLCTSHKQNMFDETGFFHILDSQKLPWLTWVFWPQGQSGAIQLWMISGDSGLNFLVGDITAPKLMVWYHVCVSIDADVGTAVTMVNGDQIGMEIKLRKDILNKMPRTLQDRIVLGSWFATWTSEKMWQFDGSVGNIRLFSGGFNIHMANLSGDPCGSHGDLFDWEDMEWEEFGEGVQSENTNWAICYQHMSTFVWLVLPEAVSQENAIRSCALLGHGHIIPVINATSLVLYQEMFGEYAPGLCSHSWTPFSDVGHENEFRSLEDNSSAVFMPWLDGQPNGAMVENSVVLSLDKLAYLDTPHDLGNVCAACDIPLGLLLQLRGACKSTFLGKNYLIYILLLLNFRYKLQYLQCELMGWTERMEQDSHKVC